MIPAFFVGSLVDDRTNRGADVIKEISGYVGGQQTFLGPTLAVTYSIPPRSPLGSAEPGMYLVFPHAPQPFSMSRPKSGVGRYSQVPVFQADLELDGTFDLTGVPAAAPPGAELDWSRSEIVVGVSDPHGALADATLTTNGKTSTLVPARSPQSIPIGGDQNTPVKLTFVGHKGPGYCKAECAVQHVASALRFSGAQRVAVLAYGKTTHLTMQGDWPSPGFDGGSCQSLEPYPATDSMQGGTCPLSHEVCAPKGRGTP